ncbi:MAG: DUF1573 domain-containing protein [Crocinitomicaceae bacterium]|nr:DUF1573 domain-containing protein [Crocinitomicaceae bacterium]
MKKYILPFALFSALISCDNSSSSIKAIEGEVRSGVSSNSKTDAELEAIIKKAEIEEKERKQKMQASVTMMTFDKLKHDFGDVESGSENTTRFKVTNTGKRPLIIEDVSASCGCTLPEKPEKPIAPGESDDIVVTFKPKPGQKNEIKKTVTVTANTDPAVSQVEIRAFVK